MLDLCLFRDEKLLIRIDKRETEQRKRQKPKSDIKFRLLIAIDRDNDFARYKFADSNEAGGGEGRFEGRGGKGTAQFVTYICKFDFPITSRTIKLPHFIPALIPAPQRDVHLRVEKFVKCELYLFRIVEAGLHCRVLHSQEG